MSFRNLCSGKSRRTSHNTAYECYKTNEDQSMIDIQPRYSERNRRDARQVNVTAPEIPNDHLKFIINKRDTTIAELCIEIENLTTDYGTLKDSHEKETNNNIHIGRQNYNLARRLNELDRDFSEINRLNHKLTWKNIHLEQKDRFCEKEHKDKLVKRLNQLELNNESLEQKVRICEKEHDVYFTRRLNELERYNESLEQKVRICEKDHTDNLTRRFHELQRNNKSLDEKVRFNEKELKDAKPKLQICRGELRKEKLKAYPKQPYEDDFETGGNKTSTTHTGGHIKNDYENETPGYSVNEYNLLKDQYHGPEVNSTNKEYELESMRIRLRKTDEDLMNANAVNADDKKLLNDRISKLTQEKNNTDTKTKWRESQTEVKALQDDKTNNKIRIAELLKEINSITTDNSNLQKENDQLRQNDTRHRKMQEQYQKANHDYDDLKISNASLQNVLRQSELTLQNTSLELDTVKTRMQRQIDNSKTLETSKLEQEKRDLETCVSDLERQNEDMQNTITLQNTSLESVHRDDEYNAMLSKLHRTEMEFEEAEKEKKILKTHVADVEKQNNKMKDSITKLTTQLESTRKASVFSADYNVLESKLRNTETELREAKQELAATRTRLHTLSDKDVCMNNEIATLRTRFANLEKELQQKNQEVKKYMQEISGVQQTKQDKDKRVDALCKERDTLKQKLNERDYKEKELRSTIAKKQQQMDRFSTDHITEIAKLNQQRHVLETYVTKLKQENNRMKADIQRLTTKLERAPRDRHSSDDYEALQNRLHRVQKELKETEFELENTKTSRLNKHVGDKLTDNNPNIVYLSDVNRPSKLADRYKELYENQWTDAFEILEKSKEDEEQIIHILLEVFIETKRYCEDKTRSQMETTLKAVTHLDKVNMSDVPVSVLNYIYNCTKASSAGDIKKNYEGYKMYLQDGSFVYAKEALSMHDYLKECFEIC